MDIRKLRLQRAWSQEQLAECSGLSVRTIQRLEKGGRMSLESRKAIGAAFDIDAGEFEKESEQQSINKPTRLEQETRDEVKKLKRFYKKIVRFGFLIGLLLVINLIFSPDYLWVVWPALGWIMVMAWKGLQTYVFTTAFGSAWEERQVQKRLDKKNNKPSNI
ncbi:MAG TPA: helix-turn-helix domain-containing protein [Desulfocapsa sulfexigens]|nr:helix-turn-helix domain-containing protein [Desulfocapsa sulfexigens]